MLQFNHSLPINSNAVYPNVTASAGISEVLLDFTQTYDNSKTSNVKSSIINVVSPSNEWLIFQLTGSLVPTASGQYNVDIWEYTSSINLKTWGTQDTQFGNTSILWSGESNIVKVRLLSTERAYISGSNEYSITEYLLPENGGTYATYNHP
jgi:hypothetical protein